MRHSAHCILAVLLITSAAEAQETGSQRARVSELQISRLDDPSQRATSQLPADTKGVRCSFEVNGLPRGSRLELHWFKGDEELTISDFNAAEGTSTLSSRMESDAALDAGDYRAEVWIDDVPEGRVTFTIEEGVESMPRDSVRLNPRVSDLVITTAECVDALPTQATDPLEFSGFVEAVSLCLQYEHMAPNRPLEVRWYDDASPQRPMTVTTFAPDGSGELEASYLSDGPMSPGSYHVVVALGNRAIERASFVVEP